MSAQITPVELAAYATMKRAIVSIRLSLGKQAQELGGISLVQFEILLMLEQSERGLRMHELADAVGISRSGLTYQVGQLEKAGWVLREGGTGGAAGSRAVIAVLTDAGRAHILGLQERHFEFVRERVFGRLAQDEIEQLSAMFQRIADGSGEQPERSPEPA